MKKLICLLALFPSLAQAISCSSGGVNLAAKDGPLYPLRVTNQNGLGICHIEQLHKMVKAKLSGHPDLSRVQMAITEKSVRDAGLLNKKAVRWMDKDGTPGGTYIDAGNSCEAFNRLKGQSVCGASNDRIEQLTKMNPDYQEKIIEALSVYYDGRPKLPWGSGPSFSENSVFAFNLSTAMSLCPVKAAVFKPLKSAYVSYIGAKSPEKLKAAQQLESHDIMMSGHDYLLKRSYQDVIYQALGVSQNGDGSAAFSRLKTQINAAANDMSNNEACVQRHLQSYGTPFSCASNNSSVAQVLKLSDFGVSLREIVNILTGDLDRDKFFKEVFQCEGKKVSIPKNINCNTVDLQDKAKKAKDIKKYREEVAELIDAQLNKKTPVGISSCTRFFRNPKAQAMKIGTGKYDCGDNKSPEYSKGEGAHAVTIVASRCKDGVKEYLVQNSWGAGCYYSADYECTKQGGFWAPADVVTSNIRNLNYLE